MMSEAMHGRTLSWALGMVALGGLLLTTGCNTMRGAGEDIQAAGSAVSGGAQKTEDKIEEEVDDATQ